MEGHRTMVGGTVIGLAVVSLLLPIKPDLALFQHPAAYHHFGIKSLKSGRSSAEARAKRLTIETSFRIDTFWERSGVKRQRPSASNFGMVKPEYSDVYP